MKEAGMVSSTSEAMRLINQGGVYIDGEKITDDKYLVKAEKDFILKVGKRKFVKIKV
jgi:tyrosyl-tRNA synthetase